VRPVGLHDEVLNRCGLLPYTMLGRGSVTVLGSCDLTGQQDCKHKQNYAARHCIVLFGFSATRHTGQLFFSKLQHISKIILSRP
jgi:hypothetical protein